MAARATVDPIVSESPTGDWGEKAVVAEEGELDLTPGMLDKNNDPVRLYLREMGSVPLLKRQDEVAIAKRMERGHLVVLKSISRSPIVLKELISVGEELRNGTLSVKKIIQFDQEELTDEETENKTREVLRIIGKIEQLYAVSRSRWRSSSRLRRRRKSFTCATRIGWRERAWKCRSSCDRSNFTRLRRSV